MKKVNERGITLIALVITIVVLLILAGVSISLLTGEDGIITQAKNAKEDTRGSAVKEARDLWKSEQELNNKTGEEIETTLEELIDNLVGQELLTEDEKDIILGNSEKGIEAEYQITIGSYTTIFEEVKKTPIAGLYETGTNNMIKSWEQLKNDGDIVVTDGTLSSISGSGDLVISEEVKNLSQYAYVPGTDMYYCGFSYIYGITGVYIPSSVKEIPCGAFACATNLKEVYISEGVTSIGEYAFYGCGFNEIFIPSSVTSMGDSVFARCLNLTAINCEVESKPTDWNNYWYNDRAASIIKWGQTRPTE